MIISILPRQKNLGVIARRPFIMFQILFRFKFSGKRAAESDIERLSVVNHFHIGRFRRHSQRNPHPAERRQGCSFPPDTGGKIETREIPYLRFRNRLLRNRTGYGFGNPAVKGGAQPLQQHFRARIAHSFRRLVKSLTTGNRQFFIDNITAGGSPVIVIKGGGCRIFQPAVTNQMIKPHDSGRRFPVSAPDEFVAQGVGVSFGIPEKLCDGPELRCVHIPELLFRAIRRAGIRAVPPG